MPDRTLTCAGCNEPFAFTEAEQEFHASRGITTAPRRCPDCRRSAPEDTAEMRAVSRMWEAPCKGCGKICPVPFDPADGKPVWCRPCLEAGAAG